LIVRWHRDQLCDEVTLRHAFCQIRLMNGLSRASIAAGEDEQEPVSTALLTIPADQEVLLAFPTRKSWEGTSATSSCARANDVSRGTAKTQAKAVPTQIPDQRVSSSGAFPLAAVPRHRERFRDALG
jgi:hypothetical protein